MTTFSLFNNGSQTETGFLADRTIKILRVSKRKITDRDEFILKSGLDFIQNTKKGKEQIKTGKLSSNSVEAADAYALTMAAYSHLDAEKRKKIEMYFKNIELELEDILNKKRVASSKVRYSKSFFEYIRSYSVREAGNKFYQNVEDDQW